MHWFVMLYALYNVLWYDNNNNNNNNTIVEIGC